MTPLQRPKQWENKERLTDAEVADLQKFAAQITENDGDAPAPDLARVWDQSAAADFAAPEKWMVIRKPFVPS